MHQAYSKSHVVFIGLIIATLPKIGVEYNRSGQYSYFVSSSSLAPDFLASKEQKAS